MVDFGYLIVLGISRFVSTTVDNIFVIIVFFYNSVKFPPYQVVIGQYIGIELLVAISIIASFMSYSIIYNRLYGNYTHYNWYKKAPRLL